MNNNFDKYGRPMGAYPQNEQQTFTNIPDPATPKRKTATTFDMVFAAICMVLSIISVDFLFWSGAGAGISLCATLLLFVAVAYLSKKGMKVGVYSITLCILYLALSVSLVFSDGGLGKFLALSLMGLTYTVIIIDTMSLRRYRGGSIRAFKDIIYAMFALTFGRIGRTVYAISHKKDGDLVVNRKTGNVFIGFALALPVLCIVIPLLVSSDAAFEGLLDRITFDKVFEIICAIIIGAFVFVLLFGQLLFAEETQRGQRTEKAPKGIETTILGSFLGVISLSYVLYLFSQLAYFFSGFSGLLPEGFTNAQYARRGFFEMTAVCAINLLIVFFVSLLSRKKEGNAPLPVRLLSTFLCVFSLLLIATSLSKMIMYIDTYGMTRLRIYTSVFMVFLAVVFFAVIVRLFVRRMPYMKAALIAGAVLVSLMCFFDIDGVIAKYNVCAYLDGRLDTVDMNALDNLSSDAVVPYVFELIDDDNEDTAAEAKRILSSYAEEMFYIDLDEKTKDPCIKEEAYDFRRYNIPEYKARKMLLEKFDEYYIERYPRFDIEAAEEY